MPQFINFRGRDGCLCRQFPDGVTSSDKARNAVMQVSLLLYSTWAVRMDALMAIDDMLGTRTNSRMSTTPSSAHSSSKYSLEGHRRFCRPPLRMAGEICYNSARLVVFDLS